MGILSRISEQKQRFQMYRAKREAQAIQRDAQKLQTLETRRTAIELRAQQRADIDAEEARISAAKKQISPFSRAVAKAKSFQSPKGVNKGLRGAAKTNRTSRPSLFAQNSLNTGRDEGYKGFSMETKKKKGASEPFSYRGLQ